MVFTICNTFYLHISETRKLVYLTQVRDLSSKWSWAPQDWSLEEKKNKIIICAIISVKLYNNHLCNHNYVHDYTHLQITIVFMIMILVPLEHWTFLQYLWYLSISFSSMLNVLALCCSGHDIIQSDFFVAFPLSYIPRPPG